MIGPLKRPHLGRSHGLANCVDRRIHVARILGGRYLDRWNLPEGKAQPASLSISPRHRTDIYIWLPKTSSRIHVLAYHRAGVVLTFRWKGRGSPVMGLWPVTKSLWRKPSLGSAGRQSRQEGVGPLCSFSLIVDERRMISVYVPRICILSEFRC